MNAPALPARVVRAGLLFLGFKFGTLLVNAVTMPRLRAPEAPGPGAPEVSILIPARDEARHLAALLPAALRQGAREVLVLDDGSTDRTAQVARGAGARVIPGAPMPPDWTGKSWACHQLAAQARGEILLFLDADVRLHRGAAAALAAHLQGSGAGLVSVLPRPQQLTVGTRLLAPLVDVMVLTWLPYPAQRLRWPGATTANAQVMAFRRAAYDAAGGHRAVRGELLEGTYLARRVRAAGWRVTKVLGASLIGIHPYRSYPASVRGFSKHALRVHLGSRGLMVALGALHFAVYTWPWLTPARGRAHWALRLLGPAERLAVNLLTGRRAPADLLESALVPLTLPSALPAYWLALRAQVGWKGRTYGNGAAVSGPRGAAE